MNCIFLFYIIIYDFMLKVKCLKFKTSLNFKHLTFGSVLLYDLVVMSFRRKLFDNEKGNLIMIAAVIIIKA